MRVFRFYLPLMMVVPVSPLLAATTTSSFTVSSVITSGCALGTNNTQSVNDFGTLSFGSMSSISENVDVASSAGAGSVIVTCTPGLAVSIALDYGIHNGSSARRYMENSATSTTLGYQLYQDASYSNVWGTGEQAYSIASFPSTTQTYTVYGRLYAVSGLPAAGTYSDTVTVTLTY